MKTTKTLIILVLCLIIAFSMTGCATTTNTSHANEQKQNSNQINDQYETVGEIIVLEEDTVHVLTGDVAEIFKVDQEKVKDFYLGETVGVKKISDNQFELEKYKINNFDVKHTNMGHMILTVSGKIKEMKDDKFIMSTKDEDMEFETPDEFSLEKGTEITVDYLKFQPESQEKILIDVYDETSKINLTVTHIRRAENGIMVLDTEDEKGLKYEVYVLGRSVLNFNHSDLKEHDEITVYPEVIREIYPTQIDAKMIKK
ncbi:MAG: hypothetical protein N4A62_13015 [Marinisporobacter sp.]|jgi:hypothetical protein|nr:hypothetical protein [Marinisporobacter sp.]